MNKEKRQKLVDFISKSFADAPYPENGYVGFELEDFEGLHWKDVTPELLCTYVDELVNFSGAGWRFFLPAILSGVILHSKEIGRLADNIIRTFAVPPSENSGRFADNTRRLFTKRLTVLTSQEKIAVRAFVEAFKELEPYAIGKL